MVVLRINFGFCLIVAVVVVVVVVVTFALDYIFRRILTLNLRVLSAKYWQILRGIMTTIQTI